MKELKQVLKKEEDAGLKGVLWALRKKSEDLEPEEREMLDLLFQCSPLLRKAYRLREKLNRAFDNEKHTVESGRRAIRRWMAEVRESGLSCFDEFLSPPGNPGRTDGFNHELLYQPFIERLGRGTEQQNQGAQAPLLWDQKSGQLVRRIWLDLNGYEAFAH